MKLFVYEHITSGALTEHHLPDSLAREGDKMLAAALQDCHDTQQCSLLMLRDSRLDDLTVCQQNSQHHCLKINNSTEYQQAWQHSLKQCDAVLIIAPETDDILASLQQQALEAGKKILGCQPKTIRLSSDKLRCYQHLAQSDIATIPTYIASQWQAAQANVIHASGYIVKPIDGAGCLDTFFFNDNAHLEHYLALNQTILDRRVIQPYIDGIDVSLCVLASNADIEVLSINQQQITQSQGKLTLSGCIVNSQSKAMPSFTQANQIAQKVKKAFTGLYGFIGIDLIVTETQCYVVDINPRLTTSYIGLRTALNLNPMQWLFDIIEGNKPSLPALKQQYNIEIVL